MGSNRSRFLGKIAKGGVLLALLASLASPGYLSKAVQAADFTGALETRLVDIDGLPGDELGYAVAISGDTAVVGAPADDFSTGSVSVFVRSGDSWTQQAKLTGTNRHEFDQFGSAVAISGDTVVVGAQGFESNGAAYVFVRAGTVWTEQAVLLDSDGVGGGAFGNAVAINGDTAVVGDRYGDTLNGAAYVFVRNVNSWTEQQKIVAAAGAADDEFGYAVAISGDTVLIGAYGDDGRIGAGYVFVRSGPAWSQQQKLTAGDGAANDRFGYAVAISGDTAVLGASGDEANKGSAYLFVRSGTDWSEQQKLMASDGAAGDQFGYSVAISGNSTVVSSYRDDSLKGSAYVFVKGTGLWDEQAKLTADDGVSGDQFGTSVAISGDTAVVGSPFDDVKGSAYIFFQPTEANVSATVTVQTISISASIPAGWPTSVDYGQIMLNTEAAPQSYTPGPQTYLRVVNNGNVAEDFLIKGADATAPGGGTWTLAAAPGADRYVHSFAVGQTPSTGDYSPLTTSPSSLMGSVLVGDPVDFNLKIHTPTASTVFGQYSTRVTIVAIQN